MKWLALHIGGQKWTVHLVSSRSKFLKSDEGAKLEGSAHFDKCRIYLNKDQNESTLEDTLLHELLHAALFVSGAHNIFDEVCPAPLARGAEERIILGLTPVLHRLISDLGFRFPKRG